MATTRSDERSMLTKEEFDLVAPSHFPALATLPAEELRSLATRLREHHARARDLMREGRRARRGKGDARAASSASALKLSEKKQVFAAALKRVNSRFALLTEERRREEHRAALRAALARKQAARAAHPQAGWSANAGMRAKAGAKPGRTINPGRIGSVSQQNKVAQAQRDG